MFSDELREKAQEMYRSPQIYEMFSEMRTEGVNTDAICLMFIGIVMSLGVKNGTLSLNVPQIELEQFTNYLRIYLQGQTSTGETIKDAQFAGKQVAFFARVVIVGTLLTVFGGFLFGPVLPLVQVGLFTVGVSLLVGAFLVRPSRDVSSQAVILIVFQQFLLSAHNCNIDLRRT